MAQDIYELLREQLDQYSVGFPKTRSGVEMKILRKLFNEQEARMFLHLSLLPETPEQIAKRIKEDAEEVSARLHEMAEKGLVYRLKKGEGAKYSAVPFVVGLYEFQLNRMDKEFAALMEQYFEEAFGRQASRFTVPMRTIPVGRALTVSWPVAPYEDVREIIKGKDRIAVADCICRVQKGLLEDACDKPLEVCFAFGSHAQYYVDRHMGRWISQEEALKILDHCEEVGLVPQPFNAKNPGGMCNCCGDCCGILRSIKKHPKPAQLVITNYYAEVDGDSCVACGACIERCQMEAVSIGPDDVAVVDLDRCIGCGLCVTTCPSEAMSLQKKPDDQLREPPASGRDVIMELARQRGKSLIPLALQKSSWTL